MNKGIFKMRVYYMFTFGLKMQWIKKKVFIFFAFMNGMIMLGIIYKSDTTIAESDQSLGYLERSESIVCFIIRDWSCNTIYICYHLNILLYALPACGYNSPLHYILNTTYSSSL